MTFRKWIVPTVIGLAAGIAGIIMVGLAQHLWQDHLALHELAVIEMRRLQSGGTPTNSIGTDSGVR